MTEQAGLGTSDLDFVGLGHIAELQNVHDLAAWPDLWVLRAASTPQGHALYGFDVAARRFLWSISGLNSPEGLGWSWSPVPLLARAGELAVAATYVGRNRERVWLLALEPRTGDLVWRKPLAWHRRAGGSLYERRYIGIVNAGEHLLVMENRAARGESGRSVLMWLDPATGETVHGCPAPAITATVVVAGGYVYLHNSGRREYGLYRAPLVPGADGVELHWEARSVTSLCARDGRLYAIHTEEDEETGDWLDWTFGCYDGDTLEALAVQSRHWDQDSHWSRLRAADPERPDHVVISRDTQLWGLDLAGGETLWEHTFNYSTTVKQVLLSPHGALLNADRGVEGLDLLTGERRDLGIEESVEFVFPVEDYLLTSLTFGEGSNLYARAGTPAAEVSPATAAESWTEWKLRKLLPDLLTDPRDELETAFGKAAGRGGLNTLAKRVRQIMGIGQTHKKVKDYLKALKAGELDSGPLNFIPLGELHQGFFFYSDLFGFGPDEHFFPGVLIAGEFGGVEFYLMWATGQVISLHHDATFYEVAYDVWNEVEERTAVFEREFPEQGGALDIAQLVRFQRVFAGVEDTGALSGLETRDLLTRTAAVFGWSLEELRRQLEENYLPLEFLPIYDEELEVLEEMLAERDL